jgi:O-antigen ligase
MIKIIKTCLWAVALFPLIIDIKPSFNPSSTAKIIFFRFLIFVISILFTTLFFYKKSFRDEIIQKTKKIIKNPIVISVLSFILVFAVSTIFATDKYTAFWGNLERGEGLVGMLYFLAFFIFSLFIFEKRDWMYFFKISLFVTLIILAKEFSQYLGGEIRPGSIFGNPTLLNGYLIFSILSSIVVFEEIALSEIVKSNKKYLISMLWKYLSLAIFVLSIVGIFITETRGTILGVALGISAVIFYIIFNKKSKEIFIFKKINIQKLSVFILGLMILFSSVFIITRKNEIWQKVPGLSRIAIINEKDQSTNARLILGELSLKSINPIENGVKNFLIGWGPENFGLAYGKYFNPEQFKYENSWFDRTHNKFLDVLVMNGLIGLFSYFAILFFYFKFILKRKDFSLLNGGFLFFGVALVVHLLFLFDQITTSIPFFGVLALIVCLDLNNKINENDKKHKFIIGPFLVLITIFLSIVFIRNDLIGYIQSSKYSKTIKQDNTKVFLEKSDSIFYPFTTAQFNIREDFMLLIDKNYTDKNSNIKKLSELSLQKGAELIEKNPYRNKSLLILSSAYLNKSQKQNDKNLYVESEKYFRELLELAPNRADYNYNLASNLFLQKMNDESFVYYEKAFNLNEDLFTKESEKIYENFFKYFFETKNKESFIITIDRLRKNNYENLDTLNEIINYINKYNSWPKIDFNFY